MPDKDKRTLWITKSGTLHAKDEAGRSFEQDNLDDSSALAVMDMSYPSAEEFLSSDGAWVYHLRTKPGKDLVALKRACKRCFPNAPVNNLPVSV